MIIRSVGKNFELADWTEEVNIIPNQWGTINNEGVFTSQPVTQHTVQFEEISEGTAVLVDRVRGDKSQVGRDPTRKIHTFAVPHFPLTDYIYPRDIQGQTAYGQSGGGVAETLAKVRTRKMEAMRKAHARTLEKARAVAITTGTVYSPSGTVSQNWFTEFGVSQTVIDFAFTSSSTAIGTLIENAIAAIQDNAGSVDMTGISCFCSPAWFSALVNHARVANAFQMYSSSQEPLRQRLAANGSATALQRRFFFQGVTFIEMRDAYDGTPLIPAGTAHFIPTGTDVFKTYFSPAERLSLVNTFGEEMYMFEKENPDICYEYETESNHVSALLKPALVVKATQS